MPTIEAFQMGLGWPSDLAYPARALDARLGYSLFGFEDSWYRVVCK
jgi:hypothetical protein